MSEEKEFELQILRAGMGLILMSVTEAQGSTSELAAHTPEQMREIMIISVVLGGVLVMDEESKRWMLTPSGLKCLAELAVMQGTFPATQFLESLRQSHPAAAEVLDRIGDVRERVRERIREQP